MVYKNLEDITIKECECIAKIILKRVKRILNGTVEIKIGVLINHEFLSLKFSIYDIDNELKGEGLIDVTIYLENEKHPFEFRFHRNPLIYTGEYKDGESITKNLFEEKHMKEIEIELKKYLISLGIHYLLKDNEYL